MVVPARSLAEGAMVRLGSASLGEFSHGGTHSAEAPQQNDYFPHLQA